MKRNAIIAYYLKSLWPASVVLLLLLLAIFMHAAFCSGCREIQSCCGRLFWEIRISDWLQMGLLVATLAAMFAARHVAEMKIASDMLEKYGVKEIKINVSALAKVNVPAELKIVRGHRKTTSMSRNRKRKGLNSDGLNCKIRHAERSRCITFKYGNCTKAGT